MFIKYLINPTAHVLRSIEGYGGEVLKYHDFTHHSDVVVTVPGEWLDIDTPKWAEFSIPTPSGVVHVREIMKTWDHPRVTVIDEVKGEAT